MLSYLENCVRIQCTTTDSRTYLVMFGQTLPNFDREHFVTLTWNGDTDRPNTIRCDCGKRSCIPLRLVRDLERHGFLA